MSREQNRRRRRKAQATRSAEAIARSMRGQAACADCSAVAAPRIVAPGVVVLTVAHDDSCPALAAMTRSGRS